MPKQDRYSQSINFINKFNKLIKILKCGCHVFNQEAIYAATTRSLVGDVLRGYNATVFAYGATGSGKTHTMVGSTDQPGIMVRALEQLFTAVGHSGKEEEYKVRSFSLLPNKRFDLPTRKKKHSNYRNSFSPQRVYPRDRKKPWMEMIFHYHLDT